MYHRFTTEMPVGKEEDFLGTPCPCCGENLDRKHVCLDDSEVDQFLSEMRAMVAGYIEANACTINAALANVPDWPEYWGVHCEREAAMNETWGIDTY